MNDWYYSEFGQTKGPVSIETILQKILKQELELDSYVTEGVDKPWKKIKDIPELMDKVHEPANIPHASELPSNFMSEEGEVQVGNLYFYIPIKRLIIMSIISLGFYQLYWIYKQWYYWDFKHRKTYQRPNRYYDWIFFPWTIFQKIETDKDLNAVERSTFSGVLVFWRWAIFAVVVFVFLTAFKKVFGLPDFTWYLIASLDCLMLLPVQLYINRVNSRLGNTYEKPGIGHYLSIAVGISSIISYVNLGKILSLLKY